MLNNIKLYYIANPKKSNQDKQDRTILKFHFTFNNIHHRAACCLGLISSNFTVSVCATDDHIIEDNVEVGIMSILHQEVRREIVQSVSTRGNFKHPDCVVIATIKHTILTIQMYPKGMLVTDNVWIVGTN